MNASFGDIWLLDGIEPAQEVLLDDWRCFEVQLPGMSGRTCHLSGKNVQEHYWEVSSAISEIDLGRRVCEMVSGQIYILGKCNNSSGISRQYLWWSWVNRNNARDIVEVTVGVSNSLAKAV